MARAYSSDLGPRIEREIRSLLASVKTVDLSTLYQIVGEVLGGIPSIETAGVLVALVRGGVIVIEEDLSRAGWLVPVVRMGSTIR
jgi:hypothetical protein